jgi:hypothetical protein
MWKRQAAVETGVNNPPIFFKNNKKKRLGLLIGFCHLALK